MTHEPTEREGSAQSCSDLGPSQKHSEQQCQRSYSSFVCLSSAPVVESNIPSLANWLLTFYSKFLEDSDLEAISSFLKGLYSHPGLTPLPPRSISSSSSSSSSGQRKPRKSIG